MHKPTTTKLRGSNCFTQWQSSPFLSSTPSACYVKAQRSGNTERPQPRSLQKQQQLTTVRVCAHVQPVQCTQSDRALSLGLLSAHVVSGLLTAFYAGVFIREQKTGLHKELRMPSKRNREVSCDRRPQNGQVGTDPVINGAYAPDIRDFRFNHFLEQAGWLSRSSHHGGNLPMQQAPTLHSGSPPASPIHNACCYCRYAREVRALMLSAAVYLCFDL
eukprot:1158920-Pelagomonas_calceolata.AAC.14